MADGVPFFKKGKTRPTTNRKRSPTLDDSAAPSTVASASEVVLPAKKVANNLLSQGTKRTASERDRDFDGLDTKWSASESAQASAQEIIDGDEAEQLILMQQSKRKKVDDEEDVPEDGLYRGQAGYKSHIRKGAEREVPKTMRAGPVRSTNTIRTVTIVDYQPDVCKDYKETGYCGFGDTCKFLHDRGTYLAGWQLDKLAENPKANVNNEESSSDEEDIPFACLICRKPYTDPIVTRCGHYFCSACAIKRFAKTPKCLACGSPTGGIFNRAEKVVEKMRAKVREKEAANADEDVPGVGGSIEVEGLGDDED